MQQILHPIDLGELRAQKESPAQACLKHRVSNQQHVVSSKPRIQESVQQQSNFQLRGVAQTGRATTVDSVPEPHV